MKLNPEGVTEIKSMIIHTIQTNISHHIPLQTSLKTPGTPL
jgi:hypothetical protein